MTKRKVYCIAFAILASPCLKAGAEGRTHCRAGEVSMWSCPSKNKMFELCASQDLSKSSGYLLVEHKFGPLSKMSFVYAPQHDHRNASAAAQFHGNLSKIDYSLVWGKFQQDHTIGIDIATQLGDAGLRSELMYTRPGAGNAYKRALLAIDYAFANTLTLSAEWFYNGRGTGDIAAYDFNALFSGRVQNLARNYAGFYAGYEITPLWKWKNYLVLNLNDRSHYFSPSLAYSVRENVEWTVGIQHFGGAAGSEYGRMANFYYTQVQWFF